jgi:MoxR-vWA-beta-propeller ternary system domain bpX2
LRPQGKRVPCGYLPEGDWQPLADYLLLELPQVAGDDRVAEIDGRQADAQLAFGQVAISIRRGGPLREPNLLLTGRDAWAAYGSTAPQARLDRCHFALDARGRCLVRGNPLPPVPGARLVEEQGIAVPGGWQWQPRVDAAVIRELLHLEAGELARFDTDGTWELIEPTDWVFATRSAIRLSCENASP